MRKKKTAAAPAKKQTKNASSPKASRPARGPETAPPETKAPVSPPSAAVPPPAASSSGARSPDRAKPAAPAAPLPSSKPAAPASVPAPASSAPATPPPAPKPPPPRRPLVTLTLATRKSPLAVAQAELALARLTERIPEYAFRLLKLVTTGDRQEEWSLPQQGGMGLFTGELEAALRDFRADVAVHSAKDLPTEMTPGLQIAGYLPREDARDVLVLKEGLPRPNSIATSSPRRQLQLMRQFTKATFVEIRGNVETRLRRIAEENLADGTVLAAAGLKRLGITEWPGLRFQMLPLAVCVPAVGQAAIAIQARGETALALRPHLDDVTRRAVELERTFLRLMGGGCHTAFAVHYDGAGVHLFHESCGYQRFNITVQEAAEPERVAERLLVLLKLRNV